MYSEFGAIELGRQALNAQRRAIDVTGHNITNANTEGYARQKIVMSPQEPMTLAMSAAQPWHGQVGRGVTVEAIESMRDNLIDAKLHSEYQNLSYWETLKMQLEQIENIMNEPGDSNLRSAMEKFFEALHDLSLDPQSESSRNLVIERGEYLTKAFQRSYNHLYQLASDINTTVSMEIDEINSIAEQIAKLNKEIKLFEVTTQDNANDMIDRRNLLVEKLANKLNIEVIHHADHQISIIVGDNLLVAKDKVQKLTYKINGANRGFYDIQWEGADPLSSNTDVATVRVEPGAKNADYGLLVKQVAKTQILRSSQGVSNPYESLESQLGVTDGSVTINGKVIYIKARECSLSDLVRVINESGAGVRARMVEDSGTYYLELETLYTGESQHINLGRSADSSNLFYDTGGNGLQMLSGYDAQNDGVYQVGVETQASQDAIYELNGVYKKSSINEISDIKGVTIYINGTGSAKLKIKPVITNSKLQALLEVRDKTINRLLNKFDTLVYEFATKFNSIHFQGFGLNGEFQNAFFSGAEGEINHPEKNWASNISLTDIVAESSDAIAAASGEIRDGEVIPQIKSVANNENVLKLIGLQTQPVVNNKTVEDYFASLVSDVGTQAESTETALERQKIIVNDLEKTRQEKIGVSLDEEMTNLIQYQRAFQAAARFISVINEMLDQLLKMGA